MRTPTVLLSSLLFAFYGCQPETQEQSIPVKESATISAPAADEAMSRVVAEPASAVNEAAVAPVEAVVGKAVVEEKLAKPVLVEKAKAAAVPAKVTPVPVAEKKVVAPAPEITPVAVPAKSEVKAEPVVSETEAMALAKKSGCLNCHAIDKKVVGPAWKEVAVKYRGDAGAEGYLVNKISQGGGGVWGSMKMPAHPKVSETDRRTLARFVLGLH